MGVLDRLGEYVAEAPASVESAARLRLHLLDGVGAMLAGKTLEEASDIAALAATLGQDPLGRIVSRVALARATEIDDIHPLSCTTPGAILIPTALTLATALRAQGKRVAPDDLGAALQAGYGIMTWLGSALGGPSLLYRGIWPTYLLAPLGAAAVAARLLRLGPVHAASALAIALCRISGGAGGHGGAQVGCSPRWLLVGEAARSGALAAHAAAADFTGDHSLLDGDWIRRVHGITPLDLDAPMPPDGSVRSLSMKPVCAAKQTQAGLDGFRQLLRDGIDPAQIAAVTIGVPQAYQAMIGHRRTASRTDRLTSIAYLLAIAALAPAELPDITRRLDPTMAITAFMNLVHVEPDRSTEEFYPRVWPSRVTITLKDGSRQELLVTDALGDPARSLDEAAVRAKFLSLVSPTVANADSIATAALGATRDEAQLKALLSGLDALI